MLFAVYDVLLVGLVLFKFPFSYDDSGSGRHLNLIPLAGSFGSNGRLDLSEILENILVFVPLGVYLSALRPNWSFGWRILGIVATSVVFETMQFIFAIGRSDITDVLDNTLGGLLGLGVYAVLARIFGNRTNRVVTVAALVLTVCTLLFFGVILAHSLRGR